MTIKKTNKESNKLIDKFMGLPPREETNLHKAFHYYVKEGVKPEVFVIGMAKSTTWTIVVGEALTQLSDKASLSEIYDCVMEIAPSKVQSNQHYKAKIRQTLQLHYDRIERGVYAKES